MSYCRHEWEAERYSWGRNPYPINIILNRRADFRIQHCAMHWERMSEDARYVVEDQNLDAQTKYDTIVSVITDVTPEHRT
jgi:hypothetical protein